jgi:hypothetical protein
MQGIAVLNHLGYSVAGPRQIYQQQLDKGGCREDGGDAERNPSPAPYSRLFYCFVFSRCKLQCLPSPPIKNSLNSSNQAFIDSIRKKLRQHNKAKVLVANEFPDPTVLDKGKFSNTKVLGKNLILFISETYEIVYYFVIF